MKKQIITLIVAILFIIGGCNNQVNKHTSGTSANDNPSNIDKQVQETKSSPTDQGNRENQNVEVDGVDTNNAQEDNTAQTTTEPEKQIWLRYSQPDFNSDVMINITSFPNWKLNSISYQEFIKKYFSDRNLLEEIAKEEFIAKITPSSEYLILKLPQDYKKYFNYDIVSSAQSVFPNIQNYLNSSHRFGSTGITYSVIYSIKEKKIVSLDEVDNGNDKESIYDWILDPHYFYISSLNTIKHVDNVGYYDYRHLKYLNYKEDKIIIYTPSTEDNNKADIIFYDLVKGEEADHIEITDKDKIEYVYFTQWNDDGTVYFTVNYTSYKYNLKTKKLITLGINIYFPVITPDGKYLIYSVTGPDRIFSYEHKPHISDQIKPGVYAKYLETGETIFMKEPGKWGCDGIKIMTINKY